MKKLTRKEIKRREQQSASSGCGKSQWFLSGDGSVFSMTKVKGGYKLNG